MGMDVYGKAPTGEAGEYFRRNVWGWHPLWDACLAIAPDLAGKVEYGHSNDGDGLDAEDSIALADQIRAVVESGDAKEYVALRDQMLAAMPNEPCKYCGATGTRTDEVGVKQGMVAKRWCNGCDGKGSRRPFATNYFLEVEDLMEFEHFLRECGGFEIC